MRPDITAQEGNAVGKLIGTVFDFLIKAVTGLLLMSVVIALIGIINTMSLSILERRRELGLLRIIGMTDNRVRRMVTLESVLISLLGTLGGLVLGLVVSLLLLVSINRDSHATVTPSHPLDRADRHPRPGRAPRRPGRPPARTTIHQARGARRDLGHLTVGRRPRPDLAPLVSRGRMLDLRVHPLRLRAAVLPAQRSFDGVIEGLL